jgi:hypothetical protein
MNGLRAYMPQGGLWEASGIGGLRGFGDYEHTGNWSWEFYPPPYDFLAPKNSVAMPAPVLYTPQHYAGPRGTGVSGCGCGGTCGGCGGGHSHGMGQDDSTTAAPTTLNLGTLFSSGLDFTSWGIGEWAIAGLGAYLVISLFSDVSKGTKKVTRSVSSARRRARKKKQLQEEADAL